MSLRYPYSDPLPLAPARRAAICAALWQAQQSDSTRVVHEHGAVIVDDLCRLAALVDAQGISDAALACAAAEGDSATSDAARLLYSARLQLRAADKLCMGLFSGLGSGGTFVRPETSDVSSGGTFVRPEVEAQTVSCSSLRSALDTLADAGIRISYVPRRLLNNLSSGDENSIPLFGAVARMLAAAYLGATGHIVSALCAAPYCIEPGNLRAALAPREHAKASAAIAAAVSRLQGTEAKEAALAAVAALNAALTPQETVDFRLTSTLMSLEQAIMQWARRGGGEQTDADFPELLRAAASADLVWSAGAQLADPGVRVAALLDDHARLRINDDITFVPYGYGADADGAAEIEFKDAPGALIFWEAFGAALEGGAKPKSVSTAFGALDLRITQPLARAVSTYLQETTPAHPRWAWPQPDPPWTLIAPPMTFSASRLNAFVKCPRRWFYEYLCEALEDPASLHAAYGRVVHDALEALHREIRVPGRYAGPLILDRLLRELDVAFGKSRANFDSQLEYEVSRHRARRMAEQYVRWLVLEAGRSPLEIVDVEVMQRRRFGAYEFVGYIDRIDRPLGGGPVTIFDYKTGRIDTDAAQYLDKVRRGDEAQLALYYAMRRASGDEIARIALVSIRDPRDDVWILALDIVDEDKSAAVDREPVDGVLRARCSRADLDASLAALIERCHLLTEQGLDHFPAGEDPPCNFCAYARACRERPVDGERIFAR